MISFDSMTVIRWPLIGETDCWYRLWSDKVPCCSVSEADTAKFSGDVKERLLQSFCVFYMCL